MSDSSKQQQDAQPLKSPLDEKQEGQENVLADAQKVVDKLDEIQPMTVEEQEKESQQSSPVGKEQDKKE